MTEEQAIIESLLRANINRAPLAMKEAAALIKRLVKERDQQERFKWGANRKIESIRAAARKAIDNCDHPDCIADRKCDGYGSCAGGYIARRVDVAIDAAIKRCAKGRIVYGRKV